MFLLDCLDGKLDCLKYCAECNSRVPIQTDVRFHIVFRTKRGKLSGRLYGIIDGENCVEV